MYGALARPAAPNEAEWQSPQGRLWEEWIKRMIFLVQWTLMAFLNLFCTINRSGQWPILREKLPVELSGGDWLPLTNCVWSAARTTICTHSKQVVVQWYKNRYALLSISTQHACKVWAMFACVQCMRSCVHV
jgi:hypothetical protein